MTEPDPRRLLDDEPEGALRDALEVAREEVPTEEQLSALAARLGPLLGGGPGGGGGQGGPGHTGGGGGASAGSATGTAAGVATKGAVLGKAAIALLAAGVVGAGTWVALDQVPDEPAPDAAPASPVEPPVGPPTPADDAPPTPPSPTETPTIPSPENLPGHFREGPEKRPGRSRPPPDRAPPAEVPLLQRAQDALADDPARALALAEEHRRHHPDGMLAQEREVLAIDALLRLGRRSEAEARAARFRQRYPRSAQLRRIETLLSE